jgi:hypothetical protein
MHPFGIITRIRITKHFGASAAIASLAPAIFWSMVTAGRILFATIEKWFPEKMVCRALPFVVAAAFVATACVPKTNSFFGILSFALAGLRLFRAVAVDHQFRSERTDDHPLRRWSA